MHAALKSDVCAKPVAVYVIVDKPQACQILSGVHISRFLTALCSAIHIQPQGLGTSTADEAKQYFANIQSHRKEFVWDGGWLWWLGAGTCIQLSCVA